MDKEKLFNVIIQAGNWFDAQQENYLHETSGRVIQQEKSSGTEKTKLCNFVSHR